MDFVVVGLGLGALAILSGVLLVGWFAGRWERRAAHASCPDDAAHDIAMAAWRRGSGQAMFGAGSAVLLTTIGALAGSLTDQTGAFLVTTTATVAALGMLFWAYLYRARNPIPPRRRPLAGEALSMAQSAPVPTMVAASRGQSAAPEDAVTPDEADAPTDEAADPEDVDAAAAEPEDALPEQDPPSPAQTAQAQPGDGNDAAPPTADAVDPPAEAVPPNGAPVEGPKIVELAAFAARAGKPPSTSSDDGEPR